MFAATSIVILMNTLVIATEFDKIYEVGFKIIPPTELEVDDYYYVSSTQSCSEVITDYSEYTNKLELGDLNSGTEKYLCFMFETNRDNTDVDVSVSLIGTTNVLSGFDMPNDIDSGETGFGWVKLIVDDDFSSEETVDATINFAYSIVS